MSTYIYGKGPVINSEGSWCKGGWFCSGIAVFQKATVEISGNDLIKIYRVDQKNPEEIKFEKDNNPYFNEIAYFTQCILKDQEPEQCLPESTRNSIRIALAEERSALHKRKVNLK